jgi:restriction system protein
MKRLWLVRLGRNGEQESHALTVNELVLGFSVGTLSSAVSRAAILTIVQTAFPDQKANTQRHFAAQLNQFANEMQVGDIVIVPFKTMGTIGIAEITGLANTSKDARPKRTVKWLRLDVPRDAFKQDLLYSFGAFMTVCEIKRNNALQRVIETAKSGRDPGDGANIMKPAKGIAPPSSEEIETPSAEDALIDIERLTRDQIERRIASHFAGHNFTRLISAILQAEDFNVHLSPPGADGGVDIVAGRGPLGFDAPKIVVQVKSGDIIVDDPTLQSLIGAVHQLNATHGLLVSWSGFKSSVRKRTSQEYFKVRLWGRDDIVNSLLSVYDKLPEDIRAELPLQRVWMLVPGENEDGA